MKTALVALTLCCLAAPAAAQSVDCSEPMTQSDMNFCAQADFKAEDGRLNAEYKAAMARARELDSYAETDGPGAAEALKTAQRAWITYRDAACEAESWLMKGGSAEPLVVLTCMATLTAQRADDLALFLAE